jgi:DNA repair protein RadA/Sms
MRKITETIFVCSNCGNEFSKWSGQCSACGEWNTIKEMSNIKSAKGGHHTINRNIGVRNLGKVEIKKEMFENVFLSNISEFDRVLGKGIVRGSVVLFAGEPGIGKSTLLTQLMGNVGGLYVAGEESAEQINLRVKRLGLKADKFDVLETNSIEEIEQVLDRTNNGYKIAVVDSIQVMTTEMSTGATGAVNQIRECTFKLVQLAKKTGTTIFVVGHVTKEGDIAGPKLLEHMVDTVLYFEGEKNGELRILRANKNRFGPTDEVGVFKMEEKGLREIKSDEINLVSGSEAAKVGSAVTVVMEGTRPILVEIQALVVESFVPMPTRVFSGIDYNRGKLLIAVIQKVLSLPLYKYDVFVSVTGGIRIDDTGCDMAIVAAIWSSFKNLPLTPPLKKGGGLAFVGEVSLLGEVRKVRGMEKREKEAKGLGREVVKIENVRELKSLVKN